MRNRLGRYRILALAASAALASALQLAPGAQAANTMAVATTP